MFENKFALNVLNDINIYCKNGCILIGNQWIKDENKNACTKIIKLGDRNFHEKVCK